MNFDEINKRIELCKKLEKESNPTLRSICRTTNDEEIKRFIEDVLQERNRKELQERLNLGTNLLPKVNHSRDGFKKWSDKADKIIRY